MIWSAAPYDYHWAPTFAIPPIVHELLAMHAAARLPPVDENVGTVVLLNMLVERRGVT